MKNVFLIFITFILMLFLIACENTTNQDMPEAIGEKENEAVNDTQESNNNNEEPEEINLDWPKDKLPSGVPELKGITITKISDIENGIEITFTGCDENETKMYTVKLKNSGWDFQTNNDETGKTVFATKQNESLVFFSPIYDDTNDIGTITYTKAE